MCDGEDCCKKFTKFLLVVVNLFFFLLGLLMLACGIAMVAAPDKVAEAVMNAGADLAILGDANYVIKASGIFMIVLGAFVFFVGAFGFFGACCENKVLLIIYLIIVIIVLLAEVALIIFAACFTDSFETIIKKEMSKTMIKNYTQDVLIFSNSTVKLGSDYVFGYSWAITQFGAKCCGVNGSGDYQDQQRYPPSLRTINYPTSTSPNRVVTYPISCCKLKDGKKFPTAKEDFDNLDECLFNETAIGVGGAMPNTYNTQGCYNSVDGMVKQASRIAIGIAAAIVGFEIIIIILAILLICYISNGKSMTV